MREKKQCGQCAYYRKSERTGRMECCIYTKPVMSQGTACHNWREKKV